MHRLRINTETTNGPFYETICTVLTEWFFTDVQTSSSVREEGWSGREVRSLTVCVGSGLEYEAGGVVAEEEGGPVQVARADGAALPHHLFDRRLRGNARSDEGAPARGTRLPLYEHASVSLSSFHARNERTERFVGNGARARLGAGGVGRCTRLRRPGLQPSVQHGLSVVAHVGHARRVAVRPAERGERSRPVGFGNVDDLVSLRGQSSKGPRPPPAGAVHLAREHRGDEEEEEVHGRRARTRRRRRRHPRRTVGRRGRAAARLSRSRAVDSDGRPSFTFEGTP